MEAGWTFDGLWKMKKLFSTSFLSETILHCLCIQDPLDLESVHLVQLFDSFIHSAHGESREIIQGLSNKPVIFIVLLVRIQIRHGRSPTLMLTTILQNTCEWSRLFDPVVSICSFRDFVDNGDYVDDSAEDTPEEILAGIQAHQQQLITQISNNGSDEIDDEMERAFDAYQEQVNEERQHMSSGALFSHHLQFSTRWPTANPVGSSDTFVRSSQRRI